MRGLQIHDNSGPSTDGVDIDSCKGVLVEGCVIACNDDNICVKSGRDGDGLRVNRPCAECGSPDNTGTGASMYSLLKQEAERILENFGHHPSFVFFSSSNEPGGAWYKPLRKWVSEIRKYDEGLGYGGRRIYTAQSGWFYDVPPAEIEGTDIIYFHRSGYGPYVGGTIRNPAGWRGGNYSLSLKGVRKPVFCHELGQICAYPDYSVTEKFTGFLQPGNYEVFRENARANGVLPYAEEFVKCSGGNQVRLYKEELEANFRTPEIQGFELLDLHDYLGQGTALVGILDPFWESKGYGSPEKFRESCGDTVLLAGCSSYVWKSTDTAVIPVEVCHYGEEDIRGGVIRWKLNCGREVDTACPEDRELPQDEQEMILRSGDLPVEEVLRGGNTKAGEIILCFDEIFSKDALRKDTLNDDVFPEGGLCCILKLELQMDIPEKEHTFVHNSWDLYVFRKPVLHSTAGMAASLWREGYSDKADNENLHSSARDSNGGVENLIGKKERILYTRNWPETKAALEAGGKVVFSPYLSDLNYECPALSGRSVNWNGQMGPSWCRTMGVVIDEKHPIFRYFATGHSGGWQWEDILGHARGFHMEGMEHIRPIVQPIDDWNRNLLQSLIFEARVLKGRLLLVSANLEGSFEERPAAFCLKEAILRYAVSELFHPTVEADAAAIERKLFPVLRMEAITKEIFYDHDIKITNSEKIVTADPGNSVRIEKAQFPVTVTIVLQNKVDIQGILYVPEQRDRMHEGFVRDYSVEVRNCETGSWENAVEGTFRNTCRSQSVLFDRKVTGDAVRLTVHAAYGCVDKYVWEETEKGWYRIFSPARAVVQIAGIHVICDEHSPHSDSFMTWNQKSRTREIEP